MGDPVGEKEDVLFGRHEEVGAVKALRNILQVCQARLLSSADIHFPKSIFGNERLVKVIVGEGGAVRQSARESIVDGAAILGPSRFGDKGGEREALELTAVSIHHIEEDVLSALLIAHADQHFFTIG